MEDLKKVKTLITKSSNIQLLPSPELGKDTFPATLALFYSLRKLGKNVNLICKDFPKKFNFLIKKEKFQLSEANFLISIKESTAKLSQIFYEKTGEGLNLYLKTKDGRLKKDNIIFKSLDSENLLISLGIKNPEKIESLLERSKSEYIINIDRNSENENYGEINLIEPNFASFSEIVFDILETIDENLFDIDVSNSLLAGIIQGTSNFQDVKLNPKTFQKISFLMERGANFQEILSNFYRIKTDASFRLFRRVLNKLKFSNDKNLGWVILTESDFQDSHSFPSDLSFTFEALKGWVFPFQNFLCLWENKSSPINVWGVFYSPNKKIIQKILENFAGAQKGDGLLFKVESSDVQKVKDEIFKITEE